MFDDSKSFVSRAFLRSVLELDYKAYDDAADAALLARLKTWASREKLEETQAEAAFIQAFFVETWGYKQAGQVDAAQVTLIPKLSIAGAGAGGGVGIADLALGVFRTGVRDIPQVLCELKGDGANLDAKQYRQGSTRSPVEQCLDYVRAARRGLFGAESVLPWWGLVSDMNEIRVYWWDRAPQQYMRFVIAQPADLFATYDLLTDSAEARFDRFLLSHLLHRDRLLSEGGPPQLLRLIAKQGGQERKLEGDFYAVYKGVRERLFTALLAHNQEYKDKRTKLLRLCQKLLDRFIFAFYCEDMGQRMLFPPQFVREFLQGRSCEAFYDVDGTELWDWSRRLFRHMNEGGLFGAQTVPHINGGLFAPDAEIEALHVPNHVFAARNQGESEKSLDKDSTTLLYLSARYNYAAGGSVDESLSLFTLGRIFEQSITELEYRAGELEGRDSYASLSERKRNGVYYTPERIVAYLVRETVLPWLDDAKAASGMPADGAPPSHEALEAYRARLRAIRIVDPACGSGAFLITAFRVLLDERIATERALAQLVPGMPEKPDESHLIAEILERNIYGVDLNPASVEITKLALWLHSARASSPLSSLDRTIRCFNSLIGPEFWTGREADAEARERLGAETTWREAFPEVWPEGEPGGFDIVVGNPPYVKLQNMRKLDPDVADWLQDKRQADTWESTQTGNFDLYLPFIELGQRLMAPGGRMAYIAPSLWPGNEYGEGLRRQVLRTRSLDRWVDFKSFQIFDDVTTYTALQFFTKEPREAVRVVAAPGGGLEDIDWSSADLRVPYEKLPKDGEWLMATGAERALIDRLRATCARLDDPAVTQGIIVGIQTSADAIYHLRRIGTGRYECRPKEKGKAPYTVEIEDALMKPLVSGPEAKRYEEPETDTCLLFPYERDEHGAMRLVPEDAMKARFPKGWAYLKSYEEKLRRRESNAFDDDTWWRFGRNQNLDKQELIKLIVAQTVPGMRVCLDVDGRVYINNVRVNGILPANGVDPWFIEGVLNGKAVDFVFKRIGKPKDGGYYEANKQFIAPLPVPRATPENQAAVASAARGLQARWTERRKLARAAEERLATLARTAHDEHWLWPSIPSLDALTADAPASLTRGKDRQAWAKKRMEELSDDHVARLQGALDSGHALVASYADGELRLDADGAALAERIYLDEGDGRLAAAYWRFLLLSKTRRGKDAAALAAELRKPPAGPDTPAARQFLEKVDALASLTSEIEAEERALDALLYRLYELTPDEIELVEGG